MADLIHWISGQHGEGDVVVATAVANRQARFITRLWAWEKSRLLAMREVMVEGENSLVGDADTDQGWKRTLSLAKGIRRSPAVCALKAGELHN